MASDPREALDDLLLDAFHNGMAGTSVGARLDRIADFICDPSNRDVVLAAMGGHKQGFGPRAVTLWAFPDPDPEDGER